MIELLAAALGEDFDEAQYAAAFSEEELARQMERPVQERNRSCLGRLLLQELLRARGVDFVPPLRLCYGAEGKPSLRDFPQWQFSLSHSGEWVVCALSEVPIGVDVQQERSMRASVQRYFTEKERKILSQMEKTAFFDLWAVKEAYGKCTGKGLIPALRTECTLSPCTVGEEGYRAAAVPFAAQGYHLAVCVKSDEMPEIQLKYQ